MLKFNIYKKMSFLSTHQSTLFGWRKTKCHIVLTLPGWRPVLLLPPASLHLALSTLALPHPTLSPICQVLCRGLHACSAEKSLWDCESDLKACSRN